MDKRTVFYGQHRRLGAKMAPFAGWEMPVSYPSGIIAEHTAVRTSAGIFDIGHMGLIKIEGEEALPLIQNLATNDASSLAVNQCQYSILCNEGGGVIDDVLVYRLPQFYLIVANASNADKVLSWITSRAENALVGTHDNYCMLSIQGPKATEATEKIFTLPLSALKHNHVFWKKDAVLSRTGYTGEDGIEVIAAKKEILPLWEEYLKAGIAPCGLGARDSLRLEAGLPLYGHEYDEETTPFEAGYAWAVKFDKGDFIGREALLKEKSGGLKKQLVGIELEGRAIPRQGAPVFDGDKRAGTVTSGTFSPTLKKPIALAYISGNAIRASIEIRGQKLPGKIVDKAFYKRVK